MQDHQIVRAHVVYLRVDGGVGPEHRLPVVAAHREVVEAHAAQIVEVGPVADESRRAALYDHLQRGYRVVLDDYLAHRLVAVESEFANLVAVELHGDLRRFAAEEEQTRPTASVQMAAFARHLPAR